MMRSSDCPQWSSDQPGPAGDNGDNAAQLRHVTGHDPNIRKRSPFPIVVDMARMLDGYDTLETLADGPNHVIPGHDPLVLSRFPAMSGESDIVRVDLPPID